MRILAALLFALLAFAAPPDASAAEDAELRAAIDQLKEGSFDDRADAIRALADLGDARAQRALDALAGGDLIVLEDSGTVVIGDKERRIYHTFDAITGEPLGEVSRRDVDQVKVNNNLRGVIKNAIGALTLRADDPAVRRKAATAIMNSQNAAAIPMLDAAIEAEPNDDVRTLMREARAAAVLDSDRPLDERLEAIQVLQERGDREARSLLLNVSQHSDGEIKAAALRAADRIEQTLQLWSIGQNVWYGLSLGSVLLLAAIGLAITFGVMGVINMAHGEMVMLGAYTTYVVQEVIRTSAPALFDVSLFIAIPLAFLVAGAAGVGIERGIIRFLYGRPLETLLATWGISLVLQQTVRSIFGPTNKEVGTPEFMSGAFELGQLTITYNRLVIIVFALIVLAALMLLFRKTSFGLQMRAVVQNRGMASAMGIRTPWVDAMTFGLGSGIAGIAGVALSQIDNVSPNLGQSYIIDSFMVVVFGGVGNLWGTLVGAMTLGIANKFLEPYSGAVLAKIFVLVFIILFIQKRPRGLFALKGRAVEQ